MEFLLNRFRNLTVLVAAILAQLVLLAYQVKSNQDVRLIRVWAVTFVTPVARVIEAGRSGTSHFFSNYFVLLGVREENQRMKKELDRIHMENQYLRTELSTADRARSLAIFPSHSPSKTVAAQIIGNTTGSGGKEVIVNRGSTSGIQKGMAVITPDGIVGKVNRVDPIDSFVLLITDPTFVARVISQKNRVLGTLKGQGYGTVKIDYVQNEQQVERGELFFTTGDDLIFPKGLPVGEATVVRPGKVVKEIYVTPSGFQNGLEEVLIIVEGVHAPIPEAPGTSQPIHLLQPPPADTDSITISTTPGKVLVTDADRLVDRYRKIGDAQKHVYGDRGAGAPNYNITLEDANHKASDPNPAGAARPEVAKPPANR